MNVLASKEIARIGHCNKKNALFFSEGHSDMAAGHRLRDDADDLFVDLHLTQVHGLDLPLLGEDLEELGLRHKLEVENRLLKGFIALLRVLRGGLDLLFGYGFASEKDLFDRFSPLQSFNGHTSPLMFSE